MFLCHCRLLNIQSSHPNTHVSRGAFAGIPNLLSLNLTTSSIETLPDGELCGLPNLLRLLLTKNNLKSWEATGAVLNGTLCLPKLGWLYLEYNNLKSIPAELLSSAPGLQQLQMRSNRLQVVDVHALAGLYDLIFFDIGENGIRTLPDELFQDSTNLNVLFLDSNALEGLPESFYDLEALTHVNVSFNNLKNDFLTRMKKRHLLALDASHNNLTALSREMVNESLNIEHLFLQANLISAIDDFTFANQTALNILFLSENLLKNITKYTFFGLENLVHLFLDKNHLVDISEEAFQYLHNVTNLNLASNNLHDVFYVRNMTSLIQLDLSFNSVRKVPHKNFAALRNMKFLFMSYCGIWDVEKSTFDYMHKLEELDLSNNKIADIRSRFTYTRSLKSVNLKNNNITTDLQTSTFPSSIEKVDLEKNAISTVGALTFTNKPNLKEVNIRQNNLENLPSWSIRVDSPVDGNQRPSFKIGVNNYFCNCDMKYLLNINKLVTDGTYSPYPLVTDLQLVRCRTYYNPYPTNWLVDVPEEDFLCMYDETCLLCNDCDCEGKPLCDCFHKCPDGCDCWRDLSWSKKHVVRCYNQKSVPEMLSVAVTDLYMDGNLTDINTIQAEDFIERKRMQHLWLNDSNIQVCIKLTRNRRHKTP